MDLFLNKCLDFIALEGTQGTTLEALWTHMSKNSNYQVDGYIKSFVWDLLQQQAELQIKSDNNSSASKHISYEDAANYNVIISAPKQLREFLLGVTDPSMSISETQLGLLEIIGSHREKGILQTKLSEVTKIDARNLYHHLKKLEAVGLVRRLEVIAASKTQENKKMNSSTKLIILPRFASYHSLPTTDEEYVAMPSQYMREICKQLKQAKDHILVEADIVQSLPAGRRKRWKDLRARLEEGGYVQLVKVALIGKDGQATGLKLLKDYPAKDDEAEKEEEDEEESGVAGPVSLVAELSTETQCYNLIHHTGADGITQTELSNITGLSRKVMASVVDNLHKVYGVYKVPEILRKQITYRLYTQPPDLEDGMPSTTKETEKAAAIADDSSNALISVGEDPFTPLTNPPPPSPAPSTPYKALEGIKRVSKVFPITQDARRRRKMLLELLETHKVLTINAALRQMSDLEKQEKGRLATVLDRKTLERLVSALEKEKVISSVRLSIPRFAGDYKTYQIVMHKSVSNTSEEMKTLMDNLRDSHKYTFNNYSKQGGAPGPKMNRPADRPLVQLEQLDRLPVAPVVKKTGTEQENKLSTFAAAIKYGFIKAKMTRVKMFHNHIWNLAAGDDEANEKLADVKLSEIVQKFPLDLYLTVVGQTSVIDGLEELMGRGLTIEQVPLDIQTALFDRRSFARRINILMEVLMKLKLISKTDEGPKVEEVVIVAEKAEIKDITATPPVTRQYQFKSTSDIMLFWTELEYIALHKVLQDDEELENTDPACSMVDGLPELQIRASWNLPALRLTKQQKIILEKANTPNTRDEYQRLADMTGLSSAEIARYFQKKEDKKIQKLRKNLPRDDEPPKKQKKITPADNNKRPRKHVGTRSKWSPHEELILLNVFIAEMNQTEGWSKLDAVALVPPMSSDLWENVSKLVGKTPEACFRRVRTLVNKFSQQRNMVQIAKAQALSTNQKKVYLPATLEEVRENFNVEVPSHKKAKKRIQSNSALPDILKIILQEPETDYNALLAIKLLANFTEDEIVESFDQLATLGYVSRNRAVGISRGYQFSLAYQRYLRECFPEKLFQEQNAFKTLIRMQVPKQLPLAKTRRGEGGVALVDEDEDISQCLQVRQMCSGGAVSQCIKYLIDETLTITPIVPSASVEAETDEVDKFGRGGVKDHLMLFRTEADAPIPGDMSSRSIRKLFGVNSDVIMIRQFGWKMVIEKGNSFEVNQEEESELIQANKNKGKNNVNINNNNNNNNVEKNNEEGSNSKRKEPGGDKSEEGITKRRKVDASDAGRNVDLVMDEISNARAPGITLAKLQELCPTIEHEMMKSALQTLQDDKKIIAVDDQTQARYVAEEFACKWCIIPTVLDEATHQPKRDESKEPIPVRPWLTLTGGVNKPVHNSLQSRLLYSIFKNPGITNERLYQLLPILSPVAIDELLDSLSLSGQITSRTFACPPSSSLFSSFDLPWANPAPVVPPKMQRIFFTTKLV